MPYPVAITRQWSFFCPLPSLPIRLEMMLHCRSLKLECPKYFRRVDRWLAEGLLDEEEMASSARSLALRRS